MNSEEPNTGPRLSSAGLWNLIQGQGIESAPIDNRANWEQIEAALDEIWKQAMPVGMKKYILVGPRVMKLLKKYRPKPNFCKRKFKRRSKRK